MYTPTILGLAMLKVRWEVQRKDYLDNFVPLAAECIRLSESEIVSLQELHDGLRNHFGLEIPRKIVDTLLRRLSSYGYIFAQNRAYYKNQGTLNTLNFEKTQKEFLQSYEHIIFALRQFASEKHNTAWSELDTEDALLQYLNKFQFHPSSTGASLEGANQEKNGNGATRANNYIIGDFISKLTVDQSVILDFFDTVSKGHMLSQAIFLYEVGQEQRRFRETVVYADSPLLIFALGYAGKPRQAPVLEMLEMAKGAGAKLCCFRHSYDEMRGILHSCAERVGKRQVNAIYNPSVEYFIETGKSETDILLIIEQLETDLQHLGVAVVEKPSYANHKHVIDEKAFEASLQDVINYSNQRALERDVDSIAAIYRIRHSQSFTRVEECRAIFVTANSALARVTRAFFHTELEDHSIPLCYTDYVFTTLLWLKRPNQAPDLSRKRLIATCYAATQPNDLLWNKYVQEISKLETDKCISTEQYYLLRHSIYAKSELMRITQGEENVFTEGTVSEILKCIENQIRVDSEARLATEVNQRVKLEEKVDSLEERLQQHQSGELIREQQRRDNAKLRARNYARWLGRVVIFLATLLVAAILYQTSALGPDIENASWNLTKWILTLLQWVVIISGAVNLVVGFTFIPYIQKLEDKIEVWVLNLLYVE